MADSYIKRPRFRLNVKLSSTSDCDDCRNQNEAYYWDFGGGTPANAPNGVGAGEMVCFSLPFGTLQVAKNYNTAIYFYARVYYGGAWGTWFKFSGTTA